MVERLTSSAARGLGGRGPSRDGAGRPPAHRRRAGGGRSRADRGEAFARWIGSGCPEYVSAGSIAAILARHDEPQTVTARRTAGRHRPRAGRPGRRPTATDRSGRRGGQEGPPPSPVAPGLAGVRSERRTDDDDGPRRRSPGAGQRGLPPAVRTHSPASVDGPNRRRSHAVDRPTGSRTWKRRCDRPARCGTSRSSSEPRQARPMCTRSPPTRSTSTGRATSSPPTETSPNRAGWRCSRSRLAAIVESSRDAIIGQSLSGVIESWNGGAERMYGYSAWEVIGRSSSMLLPRGRSARSPTWAGSPAERSTTSRRCAGGRMARLSRSGFTVSPIRDQQGAVIGASTIARDNSAQLRAEEEIAYRAYHDKLTGLPNRAVFEEHLNDALARARRSNTGVAVLYLDLDDVEVGQRPPRAPSGRRTHPLDGRAPDERGPGNRLHRPPGGR